MSDEIFLRRRDGADIPLADWQTAVVRMPDLRIMVDDQVIFDPDSGEATTRAPGPGDAELFLTEPQMWVPVFFYRAGEVSSHVPPDFDDPHSPFRDMLRTLAADLDARIIDTSGQIFD